MMLPKNKMNRPCCRLVPVMNHLHSHTLSRAISTLRLYMSSPTHGVVRSKDFIATYGISLSPRFVSHFIYPYLIIELKQFFFLLSNLVV